MADLTANNPPSPPQTRPWPIALPVPLHQLSFTYMHTSCMAQISPVFPRSCLDFFRHPSIFPPASPQGFTPPPGFDSKTPRAAVDNYGASRFAQSGYGVYSAGWPCFVGPYGYLFLPPIQLQLKVHGRQSNRISPSQQRMVGLGSRGTGVFHPPDIIHGLRNKKRRKKSAGNVTAWRRKEKSGGVGERGEGSRRRSGEEEEWAQSQVDYDLLLPREWPY